MMGTFSILSIKKNLFLPSAKREKKARRDAELWLVYQ
jgi:hypothetical protein